MVFLWNNKTKSCHCGDEVDGTVHCIEDTNELSVLDFNCLTVEGQLTPVVGNCIYNCVNFTNLNINNKVYTS